MSRIFVTKQDKVTLIGRSTWKNLEGGMEEIGGL